MDNEKIKEITEKVKEFADTSLIESALYSNELEFEIDGVKYRVRKPTFSEKNKVYKEKVKKFTSLLADKELKMEGDLIKMYKERGIDVEEIDQKIYNLEKERQNLQQLLGKEIEKKSPENQLKTLRDQISDIQSEQASLSVRKTGLLQFSIEYQLNMYVYAYLTTLIAEKREGDAWVRIWKSYEEFENSDENFVNRVTSYAGLMVRDEVLF